MLIGNCGSLPGGILLMPDAKPDDGVLDIVAIRPRGPFGWLKVWRKVAWENGVLRKSAVGRKIVDLTKDVRDVRYATARRLSVDLKVEQEVELDGDEFGLTTALRVYTEHKGLIVKVPDAATTEAAETAAAAGTGAAGRKARSRRARRRKRAKRA
jgi:diacylglycerol kinase family enzyme